MTDRVGLTNLGNTCFLNVVLQALRYTPAICDIFLSNPGLDITPREDSKKKELLKAFHMLIQDFWAVQAPLGTSPSLVPHGFLHSFHNVLRDNEEYWYRPRQQCDAAEALQYILDSLHDSMYRRVRMEVAGAASTPEEISQLKAIQSWAEFFGKEYSPIVSQFNGQNQIRVICTNCENVSERYEPWLMLKAPIPGGDKPGTLAPTLKTCLDAAHEEETIDDYMCDKCKGRHKAKLQNKISKLPGVLTMSLKRFTNLGHKVRGPIKWNVDDVDFAPWMAFERDPFTDSHEAETHYETYAIIEHHGNIHGGHYRMYARESASVWLEYDDSSVRVVPPEQVVTQDSYIALMLPKRTSVEHRSHIHSLANGIRTYRNSQIVKEA